MISGCQSRTGVLLHFLLILNIPHDGIFGNVTNGLTVVRSSPEGRKTASEVSELST